MNVLSKSVRETLSGQGIGIRMDQDFGTRAAALDSSGDPAVEQDQRINRLILNSINEGIVVIGRDGRFVRVNRVYAERHGRTEGALKGVSVRDLLGGAVFEQTIRPHLEDCLAGNDSTFEYWFTHPASGVRRFLTVSYVPLRNERGDVEAVVATTTDNTALKLAEEAVRIDEARLQALYDLSRREFAEETDLIDHALEEAVRLTGSQIGYFHFVAVGRTAMRLYDGSCETPRLYWVPRGDHPGLDIAGIWTDCARIHHPVVDNDDETEPERRPLGDGHLSLRRRMSVPIFHDGNVVVVSGVANKATDYDDSDIRQLVLFMDEVWKRILLRRRIRRLQESEADLRSIFDNSLDGFYRVDLDGVIIKISPAMETLLGRPGTEIIGHQLADFMSDAGTCRQFRQALVRGGGYVQGFRTQFRHPGGRTVWVGINARQWFDDGGRLAGYEGMARNITRHKAAEIRLEEEKRRAEQYLDIAGAMIVALDPDGAITRINRRGCEILGGREEDLIGLNWADTFLSAEGRDLHKAEQRRLLLKDDTMRGPVEHEIITRTGERRRVLWRNTAIYDREDRAVGTLGSGEDITEIRRAERAILEAADRTRRILDNAGDGIIGVDAEGRCVFANPAALRILGLNDEEDILSETIDTFFVPCDEPDDSVVASPLRCLRSGEPFVGDGISLRRSGGGSFPASLKVSPICQGDDVSGGVITFSDISRQLEVRKRLRQTDRLQAFGVLAGGIAHEINNMLTPATLHAGLLEASPSDPARQEISVAAVRQSLGRIRDLVDRLLTHSGQSRVLPEPGDIGDLVREAIGDLAGTLPSSVTIEETIADGVGEVVIDAKSVYLVLSNLVQNAVDAMGGQGTIDLKLASVTVTATDALVLPELRAGPYAMMEMRNVVSGKPVSDAVQTADLFSGMAGQGVAAELGLALVQGIVTQRGGTLTLDDRPGTEPAVRIFLPIVPPSGRAWRRGER